MRKLWIWMMVFAAIALSVNGATQHYHLRAKSSKQQYPSTVTQQYKPFGKHQAFGNQRIIKIHGTSQVNHFSGYHKHVRNRPTVGFPKGHTKEEFAIGQKHHEQQLHQQTPFFSGPSTNNLKHLSRPPPHVYHKSPSYGSGFPYKTSNAFRATLSKPPFPKKPSLVQVRPTTVKPAVQTSHITQMTPISAVSTKTTSASASYYSPTYTSFSYGSGQVHHIISSNDNNGPIREVPAPDLSVKPSGAGLALGGGHLSSHVTKNLFSGFKDVSGGLESTVTTSGHDAILNTDVSSLVKNSALNVNHFVKDSFDGFSNSATFGKEPHAELTNYDQETSVDISNIFKGGVEAEKHGVKYDITEHHHIPSNDHVIKSYDGSKLYYAPDPDPSLPVYKVPPTKDPHSTPSHGQSIDSIYIPQVTNGYAYVPGPVATLTSEELYQLMQGYPTVLSHVSYGGQPETNSFGSGQSYYHQSSSSSSSSSSGSTSGSSISNSDIGDITQYLQNPEIHNLLHNTQNYYHTQDSSHSPTTTYATQLRHTVYSPQNTQYATYLQLPDYKPFSHAGKSIQSTGPQTFDTSESDHDYEPEASESRNTATVIRQTKEGTVGASDRDSLPEDSDPNDLSFSASEESQTVEEEPHVYHFKNIPEVPFYSSLPSEEAAKTLAGLQAAGSVANNFLNNIKAIRGDQEAKNDVEIVEETSPEELIIEEVTSPENFTNMGYYQFSGFKKLDDDKTESNEEEETTVTVDKEEQLEANESKDNYSSVRNMAPTYRESKSPVGRREPVRTVEDLKEEQSEELIDSNFKQKTFDQTFGERLRPKSK